MLPIIQLLLTNVYPPMQAVQTVPLVHSWHVSGQGEHVLVLDTK